LEQGCQYLLGNNFIFQQNGVQAHRTRSQIDNFTQDWLRLSDGCPDFSEDYDIAKIIRRAF